MKFCWNIMLLIKVQALGSLLIISFILCGFSYAQSESFTDEARARYICGFIRQVNWHNNVRRLTMGVLESDNELSNELRRQATRSNLRGKRLNVISLTDLNDLPNIHLLFVNKNKNPEVNIESLMNIANINGFLLITEAAVFQQSMINFVVLNGKTFYEANLQALRNAGFTYSPVLPFGSVKNREDWEALFIETKQELDDLKIDFFGLQKEIEKQKQEITRQKIVISDNTAEIALMSKEIEKRQEQIDSQVTQLEQLSIEVDLKQKEMDNFHTEIEQQMLIIEEKQNIIDEQSCLNTQYSYEIDEKMTQIGALNTQISEHLATLKMQNIIMVLGFLLIVFLTIFGFYIYRNYQQKQRVNQILNAKNEEIILHRDLIVHQNKEITDSIIYARRIQNAVLPAPKILKDYLEMYIFYRPRNIVSGDFYWMSKKDDKLIIVAADCTGHGVPGAFMSMLGVAFLNEIINKEDELYANEILNKLRDNVIRSLNQSGRNEDDNEHTKDGMDIALCVIDYPSMTLQYAGAYNPLILIRNKELIEIKADKMPVAYSDYHGEKKFTNNLIPLFPADCIYMFSDGYADQFDGNDEKKYSRARLKSKLIEVCELPMKTQEKIMAQSYDEWKGSNKQIDDVLLIGIRI